jgi:hypothetical protein
MWYRFATTTIRCLSGSIVVACICAVLMAASPATAEQLAYDPFLIGDGPGEYTPGLIDGQPGDGLPGSDFFAGPWYTSASGEAPAVFVQEAGLSYLGDSAPGGSVFAQAYDENFIADGGRAARNLATPWDDTTTGTYYLSFLANYGTLDPGVTDIGFRAVEFWGPAGLGAPGDNNPLGYVGYDYYFRPPIYIPEDWPNDRMVFHFLGGYADITDTPFDQDGANHLIVLKFDLSNEAGADAVSLYLDPVTLEEPTLPNVLFSELDISLGAIGSMSDFGSYGTWPAMDEIRVGTEFADVLPPRPPPVPWGEMYDLIASHMNLRVTGGPYDGDIALADGTPGSDGEVTIADFRLWKDNYIPELGGGALLMSAAVPEPSGLILAALALALGSCARAVYRPVGVRRMSFTQSRSVSADPC